MTPAASDIWAEWLLERRHGGDTGRLQAVLARLYPVRDKVLSRVTLGEDDVLLDVGCGDGLIAFGSLEKYQASRVIFADISQDLLDHARLLAERMRVTHRSQFVLASAENLSSIPDGSVDAVTTRSVLIYISDKPRAFQEFHRVLKSKGQLSLFEPIGRISRRDPLDLFWGLDMSPVGEIAEKIKAAYFRGRPPETDPMLNFDERDLIAHAESAGFGDVHLNLEVEIRPIAQDPHANMTWEALLKSAGYPQAPTLGEVIANELTPREAARFADYLRPKVEAREGTRRSAAAFLWATK
jgi:SAM-dependent methyltransferase